MMTTLLKNVRRIPYGSSPSQYILLFDADNLNDNNHNYNNNNKITKVVIFLHGGFWKSKYGLHDLCSCCVDTILSSFRSNFDITALFEYRRHPEDSPHCGVPYTVDDVFEAYKTLIDYLPISSKIILIGHSAGGTLALSLLIRLFKTKQNIVHTFVLAPVSNLKLAAQLKLSDEGDAVQNYVHENDDECQIGCPTINAKYLINDNITFVLGKNDADIPYAVVRSCYDAIIKAREEKGNDNVDDDVNGVTEFVYAENTDHYSIVNELSDVWKLVIIAKIENIFLSSSSSTSTSS